MDHARHPLIHPARAGLRGLLALLLAATLVACGSSGGGGGGENTGATSSEETTSEPSPEPEPTTEDPDPTTSSSSTNDNPAISVARLPVGGGSERHPSDPTLRCAGVNWIPDNNEEIPDGVGIELTDALFTPKAFKVVSDGCGTSRPNCVGFVFRASAQRCDLAVRVVGSVPDEPAPEVGFKGLVYCPNNDAPSCRQFVESLADQQQITVDLSVEDQPDPGTETETPTETTTETTPETTTETTTEPETT